MPNCDNSEITQSVSEDEDEDSSEDSSEDFSEDSSEENSEEGSLEAESFFKPEMIEIIQSSDKKKSIIT